MGNLLALLVLAADISDRDGAELLLELYHTCYPLLQKIWADSSYQGHLQEDIEAWYAVVLEIVSKSPEQKGFVVVPRRWVVERTFAWITQARRLVRDYERNPAYSEAWVWLAAIHRTVKYLMPDASMPAPYQRCKAA